MKSFLLVLICMSALFSFKTGAEARGVTPVQAGLYAPIQLFNSDFDVWGVRVGTIYSRNNSVIGFDLCPGVNIVDNMLGGIQASGLVSMNKSVIGLQLAGLVGFYMESFAGIQVSGIANLDGFYIHGDNRGLGIQVSGFYNSISNWAGIQASGLYNNILGDFAGIQVSPGINSCAYGIFSDYRSSFKGRMFGLQLAGAWNNSEVVCGVQVGLVNTAGRIAGVQIGLINYAQQMSGIQIGLANIIVKGPVPFLPLVNASMTF